MDFSEIFLEWDTLDLLTVLICGHRWVSLFKKRWLGWVKHIHTQKLKGKHLENVCSAEIMPHATIYPFLIMFDPVVCFWRENWFYWSSTSSAMCVVFCACMFCLPDDCVRPPSSRVADRFPLTDPFMCSTHRWTSEVPEPMQQFFRTLYKKEGLNVM